MAVGGNQAYIYGISNFTIGSTAISYKVDKYTSSTDNLTVKIGSTTIATRNNVTGTTVDSSLTRTITFSADELTKIYNAMPTVTKATFTFTITSYISGSSIGSTSTTATGTIASTVVPTITNISLSEAVATISSKFTNYIQNQSKIKGTIAATGGTGSTIASYLVKINGQAFTTQTFTTSTLKTAGSNEVSVTVTDKRGRTATKTTTFNVLAYENPVLGEYEVVRCSEDGTENIMGDFVSVSVRVLMTALENENDKHILLEYKAKKDTTWTILFLWEYGYDFTVENQIVEGISSNLAYDFRLTVRDSFNESVIIKPIPTGYTTIDLLKGGKGVAFGKVSTDVDTLDVGFGKTFLSTETFMGGENRDDREKNLYFQSTGDGKYKHDVKLYGGNGSSSTSIGMFDMLLDEPIFKYFSNTKKFDFGSNINLMQNGKPVIVERSYTNGNNSGSILFSNGLLIQHGIASITPTAANTATGATIIFPIAYTVRPTPMAITQTSLPELLDVSIGQGAANLDRFSIYITRPNTQATTVHWIAIGYKGE